MKDNSLLVRLDKVIQSSGYSINAFAHHIGMHRAEILYQIRNGKSGLSENIARKICDKYPAYSLSWLLFGIEANPAFSPNEPKGRIIPYYRHGLNRHSVLGLPTNYLYLTDEVCGEAEFAAQAGNTQLPSVPQGSILLMRTAESPLPDKIHFIETQDFYGFGLVKEWNDKSFNLRLTPKSSGIQIPFCEVRTCYVLCAWVARC